MTEVFFKSWRYVSKLCSSKYFRFSATLRSPIVSHLYKTGVVLTYASHCDNLHVWLCGEVARSFWDSYLPSELKFLNATWPHFELLGHTKTDFHLQFSSYTIFHCSEAFSFFQTETKMIFVNLTKFLKNLEIVI